MSERVRPTLNPMPTRPTTQPKLPTAKQLRAALSAWEFHQPNHEIQWKTKKPVNAVLKSIVIEKAPKPPRTGSSITAHILKSDPTKVYFEKAGSIAPHYFGPVSWQMLPKSLPGPILNPINTRN